MSSSNAPWLCQYNDVGLFPRFRIRATFPHISDALFKFKMENSESEDVSEQEKNLSTEMRDDFLTLCEKIRNGKPINPKYLPMKVYRLPDAKLPKDNTVMFRISSGIFLVNQAVYEVFCQHSLGNTQFSQVHIYDIESQEQLSATPYYFINVAETREYFDNQQSEGIRENSCLPPNQSLKYILDPKDGDILLRQKVLSCDVDLWHEAYLVESLFFSDKLVQALFAIGVSKADFGLVQCRVN